MDDTSLTLADWRILYLEAVMTAMRIYVPWGHVDKQGNIIQHGIDGRWT